MGGESSKIKYSDAQSKNQKHKKMQSQIKLSNKSKKNGQNGARRKSQTSIPIDPIPQIRPYSIIFPLQKQTNSIKNKTHLAVKNNDLKELKKLVNYFRVDPHEELSVKGYYWCALHYAAHFKVPQVMEFLIQLAYQCYRQQFTELINIRTKNGHSPAILCVIYKSIDCLKLLLEYGGVDMELKDMKQRTILQIADAYKSEDCKKLLLEKSSQQDDNGIIKLNNIKFLNCPSLKELLNTMNKDEKEELQKASSPQIDLEKYRDLMLLGDRIPCVICLSDEGYIKYTTCCGQPIHSLCKSQKIVKCPYCGQKKFELTAEIYFPERAFQLPPNNKEDEEI